MAITLREGNSTLLLGEVLSWQPHGNHKGGSMTLGAPGSRRLFEYLLTQPVERVIEGHESLFRGLIESWENEGSDPKDDLSENATVDVIDGFRLACIETEGFGGLNLFEGPPFKLEVNRESWCLEGQNGSGKTSLTSAIIWSLTGYRIREHSGPLLENGNREPVYDTEGQKIGTWPPLVAYPLNRADLVKDAKVRVKLTFEVFSGNEAIAERSIVSKADGSIEKVVQDIDGRLLVSVSTN